MHLHRWIFIPYKKHWTCTCGEIITQREYRREYSQSGNMDVDPQAALNRLASNRKPKEERPRTIWDRT